MAYASTILDVINNVSGWETTLEAEYDEYTQEQRRFTDLMALRRTAPLNLSTETVITTNVITAAENGKTFFLNLVGGFTSTLPAAAAGLRFTFIVKLAPTTAYIVAPATADTMVGMVLSSSGVLEDSNTTSDPADQANFVASTAVAGDRLDVWCDGTVWYAQASCAVTGGITFTG